MTKVEKTRQHFKNLLEKDYKSGNLIIAQEYFKDNVGMEDTHLDIVESKGNHYVIDTDTMIITHIEEFVDHIMQDAIDWLEYFYDNNLAKLTLKQVREIIDKHNEENAIKQQYQDDKPLWFVMVIDNQSFTKEYPLESRSYKFRSDNKFFLPNMSGSSLFGNSLDETDMGVRLDWYIFDDWKIEYCYMLEDKND